MMSRYYLDISLTRTALIKHAEHILKQPAWKRHLAKSTLKSSIYEIDTVPMELFEELDNLILPTPLKNDVKFAVGGMATKIRLWLRAMKTLNNYYSSTPWTYFVDYIDHIQWTYLGSIDLVKTTKSLQKADIFPINFHAWLWLCDNCIEECITDFWIKISNNHRYYDLISSICSSGRSRHYVMCYYWRIKMENKLTDTDGPISWQDETFSNWHHIDEFMFKRSHEECFQSFIYFWDRVSYNVRRTFLLRISSSLSVDRDDILKAVFKSNLDTLMFILKQFPKFGLAGITDIALSLLQPEMLVWPYDYYNFAPNLEDQVDMSNCTEYESFLKKMPYFMYYERAYLKNDSRARKLFHELWRKFRNYRFRHEMAAAIINDLCKYNDTESMKYIVIHEHETKDMQKLLACIIRRSVSDKKPFLRIFISEILQEVDIKDWLANKLAQDGINLPL